MVLRSRIDSVSQHHCEPWLVELEDHLFQSHDVSRDHLFRGAT